MRSGRRAAISVWMRSAAAAASVPRGSRNVGPTCTTIGSGLGRIAPGRQRLERAHDADGQDRHVRARDDLRQHRVDLVEVPRARAAPLGGHREHAPVRRCRRMARTPDESRPCRSTGIASHCARNQLTTGNLKSEALTMVTVFGNGSTTMSEGTSSKLAWFSTTMQRPAGRDVLRTAQLEVVKAPHVRAEQTLDEPPREAACACACGATCVTTPAMPAHDHSRSPPHRNNCCTPRTSVLVYQCGVGPRRPSSTSRYRSGE